MGGLSAGCKELATELNDGSLIVSAGVAKQGVQRPLAALVLVRKRHPDVRGLVAHATFPWLVLIPLRE